MNTENQINIDEKSQVPVDDFDSIPVLEKWKDGKVFYYYNENVPLKMIFNIEKIMNIIENNIEDECVKFQEVDTLNEKTLHIIYGDVNKATVGYVLNGYMILRSTGFEIIYHELLHVLGLDHEFQRFDRDFYVLINFENIEEEMIHNFMKREQLYDIEAVAYDSHSILGYGSYAFSKNGKKTIIYIYDDHSVSFKPTQLDYLKINLIYKE
jgi:hypothetical protein